MSSIAAVSDIQLEKKSSLWLDAWCRLKKNKMAMVSSFLVVAFFLLAIAVPILSPFPIDEVHYDSIGMAPNTLHWFGTDILGRDMLARTFYGLRISLAVGLTATLVSFAIGVVYGAVAGFYGGKVDALMMRFVDVVYGLPYMFFVIIVMSVFGNNILILFMAIGAVSWLTMARIVRGQVLSISQKEFVEAARSCGVRNRTIIFRHLIPNALGPIIVYTTLMVPRTILVEAFLSFLGLGIQPPQASLGSLASDGASAMDLYPWLILFPGVVLAILLFALNYFGDGLRDALDPRMKK
ncbi:MAG: ABC transporter permease [Deltaproteobacteria bacterium]|nr:ABC transporter permease [Deltaproteobacteria bacterium]